MTGERQAAGRRAARAWTCRGPRRGAASRWVARVTPAALALAAAVGYERVGFYQMVDDNPCKQSAVWGITRDDGSARPVARTLRTAVQSLSGFLDASFVPLVRQQARWAAWPASYG